MRRLLAGTVALVAAAVATSAASGVGPSPGVELGGDGLLAANGAVRYVTVGTPAGTIAQAIRTSDGRVLRFRALRGAHGIPYVTYTGAVGGLSRDGSFLVLGEPITQPGVHTRSVFPILSTRTLAPRATVTLKGDFSFDALSPDGRTLFLIQHIDANDVTRYAVRAYDLAAKRLLPGAIVDRREPDEAMRGLPMRRATSADGVWSYTLYQGDDNGHPFVHALDTKHRAAFCIDLPSVPEAAAGEATLTLAGGGKQLVVGAGGTRLASIDTRTMKVSA
jgi:hypothetical protein